MQQMPLFSPAEAPLRMPGGTGVYTDTSAVFSPCERYRYLLVRTWDASLPRIAFIGLNPSTATAEQDDPTIRRIVGFAQAWGYGGLDMLNLFGFRATDPRRMKTEADPVGDENDHFLATYGRGAVAAWGSHGTYRQRSAHVAALLGRLDCLGVTKDGHPRHPLYLPSKAPRQPWTHP